MLKLGFLKDDEEGCAETIGDADGLLEGSDKGLEEGASLKLGLLEEDEDGWTETIGDADG